MNRNNENTPIKIIQFEQKISIEMMNKSKRNLIFNKKNIPEKCNDIICDRIEKKVYYNMFLHSLGDIIGFNNGLWEFNKSTQVIVMEFINLGGITGIDISNWVVSDDTLMNVALYKVLLTDFKTINEFGDLLSKEYIKLIPKMKDKAPGVRTMESLRIINQGTKWTDIPYDEEAKGNGAAMRTQPIGLFYPGIKNRYTLIALAVEASRITHNSSVGILSGITSALFTAFCMELLPIYLWVKHLIIILQSNIIDDYLKESRPNQYPIFQEYKNEYIGVWQKYFLLRFSHTDSMDGIKRDLSFSNLFSRIGFISNRFPRKGIIGGNGDTALIFAYDALLECNNSLEKIIYYSCLHEGDSDTIGAIALGWFGSWYGAFLVDPFSRNYKVMTNLINNMENYREMTELMKDNTKFGNAYETIQNILDNK